MIVDCHHHIIQHWIGACGHATREIHMRYVQRMLTRTVAKTFRARDGAPADTHALFREGEEGWSGLTDVAMRIGRNGQLEFSAGGEDYYVQYMPVGMQEFVATPEMAIAQMIHAGVDHCILQAGGAYGAMTDYNAFAQNLYPERFTGLIWVDEAMAGTAAGLAEIERGHALGLPGIYYGCEGFSRHDFPWPLDGDELAPAFARLEELGLVLCIELSGHPSYDEAGYRSWLLALGRILDRHPNLQAHLAMGPPAGLYGGSGRFEFPDEVLRVYRKDNLLTEIMLPITWGGVWDYPYPEARPLIESLRDLLGAERLIWGSDAPNVERFCTYKQSLDYLTRHCDFLSGREMDMILGENVDRVYAISDRKSRHV